MKFLKDVKLGNGSPIRNAVGSDGSIWLCVLDLSDLLGYKEHPVKTLNRIDASHKVVLETVTGAGKRNALFLSRKGVSEFMLYSNKPLAIAYKKEVLNVIDVIDEIQRTGSYIDDHGRFTDLSAQQVADGVLSKFQSIAVRHQLQYPKEVFQGLAMVTKDHSTGINYICDAELDGLPGIIIDAARYIVTYDYITPRKMSLENRIKLADTLQEAFKKSPGYIQGDVKAKPFSNRNPSYQEVQFANLSEATGFTTQLEEELKKLEGILVEEKDEEKRTGVKNLALSQHAA